MGMAQSDCTLLAAALYPSPSALRPLEFGRGEAVGRPYAVTQGPKAKFPHWSFPFHNTGADPHADTPPLQHAPKGKGRPRPVPPPGERWS